MLVIADELCRHRDALRAELLSVCKRYEAELSRQQTLQQTALQTADLRHSFDVETARQERTNFHYLYYSTKERNSSILLFI